LSSAQPGSHDTVRWWKTDLGEPEIAALSAAVRERHLNPGPIGERLEGRLAEMLGVPRVVLANNGSSALLMALSACGVGSGDEVLVPANGFIATAHAVMLAGGIARPVDSLPDSPLLDPEAVEGAVTPATRAMVAVHLNGASCDMAALRAICERSSISLVEDAAQAFGSRNGDGCLGAQSEAGAFSMSIAKALTCGEGGFVAASSEEMGERLVRLRNQGTVAIAENRFDRFGFNFRLPDLLASVAESQLDTMGERISGLRAVRAFYREALAGMHFLRLLEIREDEGELPLWTEVLCANRDGIVAALRERGVEARPAPPCLADAPHLGTGGAFPNARFFAGHTLVLPSGPHQGEERLARVAEALRSLPAELRVPAPELPHESGAP
jgi:perosamine synthetase